MKQEYHKVDTEGAAAKAGMAALVRHASGASEERPFAAGASSLDFPELRKAAVEAAESPATAAEYMAALHGLALYRDARYAHATRGFMRGLGVRNQVRGLYEKLRITLEVSQ